MVVEGSDCCKSTAILPWAVLTSKQPLNTQLCVTCYPRDWEVNSSAVYEQIPEQIFYQLQSVLRERLRPTDLRVTIAGMKRHVQKQAREGQVCLAYTSISPFTIEGSQDRNSNTGWDLDIWADAMEKHCSLHCFLWFAQLVSYRTQTTSSGMAPPAMD